MIGGKNNTSRENRMRLKKMSYAKRSTRWRCRLPAISVRRDVIIASSLWSKNISPQSKIQNSKLISGSTAAVFILHGSVLCSRSL